MYKLSLLTLLTILTLAVTSQAQTITLPALPKSSLALFKTTEPAAFEVQTVATTGNAMTYWQGTASINSTGDITGQAGIGSYANSDKAVNSTVTSVNLTGKISNPRVAWSNEESGTEDGVTYKYRSADYVADLFVKTSTGNFIIKGALVYRLRISYYYDTKSKKTSVGEDYSYVDVRACAFGPNGQVGYVSTGSN
jgi:hypothetical protein